MEKKKNLSRIITTIILCILLTAATIASCHHSRTIEGTDNGDTVAASEFAPQTENGKLTVNLQHITAVRFPKYKMEKATPYIPDSVSLAADEETVASGNYTATLLLDTIPDKDFYETIGLAAQHDTCWNINKSSYTYERKDKTGGIYKVTFSKDSRQIIVTHLNRELVKPEPRQKHKADPKKHL